MFRQTHKSVLGRCVRWHVGLRSERVDGGNVDNGSAAILSDHLLHLKLAAQGSPSPVRRQPGIRIPERQSSVRL